MNVFFRENSVVHAVKITLIIVVLNAIYVYVIVVILARL